MNTELRTGCRVAVKDEHGREYLNLPAVACQQPVLEGWPEPRGAPAGDGPLWVILVRGPHTPDEPEWGSFVDGT